jgi:hypothetical protein
LLVNYHKKAANYYWLVTIGHFRGISSPSKRASAPALIVNFCSASTHFLCIRNFAFHFTDDNACFIRCYRYQPIFSYKFYILYVRIRSAWYMYAHNIYSAIIFKIYKFLETFFYFDYCTSDLSE